jgi:hypothetical protein
MAQLLKNYIKLLMESVEDNEAKYADIITNKQQELQKPKFYGDELNNIIYQLQSLDKDNKNTFKKFKKDKEDDISDVLVMNGFSEINNGYYRSVWSRDDVDFVIKVKKTSSNYNDYHGDLDANESNQIEYNTYFNNQNINDDKYYNLSIYPKLYGYDHIDGQWIIFEKVNTFHDNIPFKKFFPLFYQQTKNAYQIVKNALKIDDYNDTFSRVSEFRLFFFFRDFLITMPNSIKFGDVQTISDYIKQKTIKFLAEDCTPRNYTRGVFENRATPILEQSDMLFKITPDLAYILNRLHENNVVDLHVGNLGYRDIKNPSKPWESFVIIDYAL